jgi:hypothetical protein
MRTFTRLSTLALMTLASGAFAQSTKPGLWEISNRSGNAEMDAAMAQMQQQMAAMPPEQRKMMEDMMARQGVSMPKAGAGGGMSMRICISPEMAARQEMPQQTEGDCTTSVTSRSGNSMKVRFECKNPPSSGEGTYTFQGDTGYTMQMAMKTVRSGKTEIHDPERSGQVAVGRLRNHQAGALSIGDGRLSRGCRKSPDPPAPSSRQPQWPLQVVAHAHGQGVQRMAPRVQHVVQVTACMKHRALGLKARPPDPECTSGRAASGRQPRHRIGQAGSSAGATPDLVAPPSTLTCMHTCNGGRLAGRCSLSRWAILSRSTDCTQSKWLATRRVLLLCSGPMQCH